MVSQYGQFKPEARSYPPEEWSNLTQQQKEAVTQAKVEAGWINGYTPPSGFTLNDEGRPVPSQSLVAAVQSVIGQVDSNTTMTPPSIPPPPALPPPLTSPPGQIPTPASDAGRAFGRSGSRHNDSFSISTVTGNSIGTMSGNPTRITIDGRSVPEAFDRNGNPL